MKLFFSSLFTFIVGSTAFAADPFISLKPMDLNTTVGELKNRQRLLKVGSDTSQVGIEILEDLEKVTLRGGGFALKISDACLISNAIVGLNDSFTIRTGTKLLIPSFQFIDPSPYVFSNRSFSFFLATENSKFEIVLYCNGPRLIENRANPSLTLRDINSMLGRKAKVIGFDLIGADPNDGAQVQNIKRKVDYPEKGISIQFKSQLRPISAENAYAGGRYVIDKMFFYDVNRCKIKSLLLVGEDAQDVVARTGNPIMPGDLYESRLISLSDAGQDSMDLLMFLRRKAGNGPDNISISCLYLPIRSTLTELEASLGWTANLIDSQDESEEALRSYRRQNGPAWLPNFIKERL